MEIEFVNGTDEQKAAVRRAAHLLLNWNFDVIPLTWNVSFVDDPMQEVHNEFAATFWVYDSQSATTRFRSDSPSFQRPFDGLAFFYEVVAHELGHALFAGLTHSKRVTIARMFGATTDAIPVLTNESKPWEDRVIEGIAETFKDAFLPRRFRRYSNRSHRRASIIEYPKFRHIFRQDDGGGVAGPSYTYGSDEHRVDAQYAEWNIGSLEGGLPLHEWEQDPSQFVYYTGIEGFRGGWGVDMGQFPQSGEMPYDIRPDIGGSS